MKILFELGKYYLFLGKVFQKPEKHKEYIKQIFTELDKLGINSVGIIAIISAFIGGAAAMQTAFVMEGPLYPDYLVGLGTRDIMLLEFSSTMIALLLAGKVGSNIASEIGTMRVTEQIDALEVMGVNSAGYLVLPKIIAAILFFPFLSIISMMVGMFGGWIVGISTGAVTTQDYIYGLQLTFRPFYILYSLIKIVVFAFIITSISAYYGYYVEGGALEVGKSSTKAVVRSSIFVLLFNLILTQLLLS